MITATVGTGERRRRFSFASREEALDCMERSRCDVTVCISGVDIAFRFCPAHEDASGASSGHDAEDCDARCESVTVG